MMQEKLNAECLVVGFLRSIKFLNFLDFLNDFRSLTLVRTHRHKVATGQPRTVRPVNNDGEIAKEGDIIFLVREKVVGVKGLEGTIVRSVDGSMFAAQVTDLAGLRRVDVTGSFVATLVRVKMGARSVAVAILWDGLFVDVVG